MTQSNIKREVTAVLMGMSVSPKAITDHASFQKDLGLDSLDFAEMVMEFELRFDLHIPFTEAEDITTVSEAVNYLDQSLKQKNRTFSTSTK